MKKADLLIKELRQRYKEEILKLKQARVDFMDVSPKQWFLLLQQ